MSGPVVGGRRSTIEIIHEILSVCRHDGANKTAVMYRSNLSYTQLVRYLDFLQRHGLVERRDNGRFIMTEKGQETFDQVSNVVDLLRGLQEEEASVNDMP